MVREHAPMNILGISAFYHDSAACLLQKGDIIAAAQEERFTRKKHDPSFPVQSIRYCLQEAQLEMKDIDYVVFYEQPFLKFERLLITYLAYAPKGFSSFIQAMPLWIKKKLWIKQTIAKELGWGGPILLPEHHASHAASAFYPSPFDRAAFLTLDGVGEWTTTSFGVGSGNELSIRADISFPHSIGMLYSAFTSYTGFKVNSGEYKVMGLAPYGEPRYKNLILKELVDLKEDGSFQLDMDYFNYGSGLTMTSEKFNRLFGGEPRRPESPITQREMDLARSIQEVTEEIMLKMARHVHRETKEKYLCLAGGVALNCVANGRLLREGPFEDIWIQPAAGDAGGALGAALYAWHHHLKNPRKIKMGTDSQKGTYLGPCYDDETISSFLKKHEIVHQCLPTEKLLQTVASLIGEGCVIGWFQGRMEFGPRALGSRSIIADARNPKMQETLNLKIKFRESFRPFAPAVKAEKVSDYFEIDRQSPYMLLVAPVKKERRHVMSEEEQKLFGIEKLNLLRSDIPSVTHVDYSARIQTVHPDTNPLFYQLIDQFEKKFGSAVLINTSFNVRGEPIVLRPEEAYRCLMRTNMDYLVMGHFLLAKKDQKPLVKDGDWQKEFLLD